MKTKTEEKEALNDELNPDYIFSLTYNELLVDAANGKINLTELAKSELKKRGLDLSGKWVGFKH